MSKKDKEIVVNDSSVLPEGFPDWANPPSLMDLKEEYDAARRDQEYNIKNCDYWVSILRAQEREIKTLANRSKVKPKIVRQLTEWRYPAISEPFLNSTDLFKVEPVTFEDVKPSRHNALLLNNQFNTRINKVKLFDTLARNLVDHGVVFIRSGWEEKESTREEDVPVFEYQDVDPRDMAFIETMQAVSELKAKSPTEFDRLLPDIKESYEQSMAQQKLIQAIHTGNKKKFVTRVVKNNPTAEIISYKNVIVDPSCKGDLDRAQFAVFKYNSCLSALEGKGVYFDLDKINVQSLSTINVDGSQDSKDKKSFEFKDPARKELSVYEYWGNWDIQGDNKLVPILATWVENTLIGLELNPYPHQEIPLVSIPYLPVTDSLYGEPDAELIKDNQAIMGALTRGMIDVFAKGALGQRAIQRGMLDYTNLRKMEEGSDFEYNAGFDPHSGIQVLQPPELNNSIFNLYNHNNNIAESFTGIKAFGQQGISGDAFGVSATGARNVISAAAQREASILRRVEAGVIKLGKQFIAMNAEFLNKDEWVRITNEEFIQISKDNLKGDFDMRLCVSTAEDDNVRAEEIAFLLQTMGPSVPFEVSKILLAENLRLRKMPHVARQLEEYEPQPDPVAQEKAMLENERIKAETQNELAWAYNRMAGANKINSEARAADSEADIKDLDYLNEYSGTTHERSLDKIRAQAASQAEKSVIESGLRREESIFEKALNLKLPSN